MENIDNSKRLHAVAMYPLIGSKWDNSLITKDCGLVPFLFHKLFGMDADMVKSVFAGELTGTTGGHFKRGVQ